MEKRIPSRIKRIRNMKIKKSTLGMFVAAFTFVFSMFYVFAGESPKLIVSQIDDANVGDTVTVTVNLKTNKAYSAVGFTVNFDSTKLQLTKSSVNSMWRPLTSEEKATYNSFDDIDEQNEYLDDLGVKYWSTMSNEVGDGQVMFFATVGDKADPVAADNTIATLKFKVKDGAQGKNNITLDNIKLAVLDEGQEVDLNPEIENGYISVSLPVDMDSVALVEDTFDLQKGEEANLVVTYSPDNTTDLPNLSYEVISGDAVTVDENGKITAVKAGAATVKVTAFGKELTANVTVTNHITKVTINAPSNTVNIDSTLQLTAEVEPGDTDDSKVLTWASSNTDAATVDQNGLVTPVAKGTTTITATSVNGIIGEKVIEVFVPIESFTASGDLVTLNKGQTHTIVYSILPADPSESTVVEWKSGNDNIATVSSSGVITATGAGETTITGTLENKMSVTVNVKVNVPLEKIEVSTKNVELLPTQTQEVTALVTPSDTTDTSAVVWSSSDDTIATVADGVITAVAAGDAVITVTKGEKSDTVNVHVLRPITDYAISESVVELNRNESKTLTVNITPSNAEENTTVTWSSSDPESVSVDQNGKITGLKGTQTPVTITGKFGLNNSKEVTASVTVVVKLNDISLNKTSTSLNKGQSETLTVTYDPEDTSDNKTVTWGTSDASVATVDNGVVTAVGPGNAVITATVGTHSKTCAVEVLVPIEKVEINSENFSLNKGETKTLGATVTPSDTTDNKTISWSSSNDSIATVDSTGKVTAISAGTATITASASGKSATVDVTVKVPITKFTVSEPSFSIVKNTTKTIVTTIEPEVTTDSKVITWTSSKESVATVDSNGVVTGKGAGTATITGKLENGMEVNVSVTVTIIEVESITVSEKTLDMLRNDQETLTVSYSPENATEVTDVIWSSSAPEVASVDENGVVTALKEGTAIITATMGELSDSANVTVTEVALTGISLEKNEKTAEVGKPYQIEVTKEPFNATDDVTVTYESSDPSIATVDENGVVTTKGTGVVRITVKASNGTDTYEQSFDLTVNAPSSPTTGVTPIWIYGGIAAILLVVALVIYKKKELF